MGSHTVGDVLAVPPPWLPGDRFLENAPTAWQKGNLGRLFVNSLIVAVGITVGKIAVSLLSAFAITYFRFRYRMLAFWLIFVSLMLPVEVRILPTYEAVANVALPLQWLIDVFDVGRWIGVLTGQRVEIALEWNMMNSYGGLILPLIASATATFLFRQFFLTVPEELCEAARIDGASPMRFFRQRAAAAVDVEHGGAFHHPLPLWLEPVSLAAALHHRQGHGDRGDRAEVSDPAVGLRTGLEHCDERRPAGHVAAGAGRDGAAALAGEGPGRQRQVESGDTATWS